MADREDRGNRVNRGNRGDRGHRSDWADRADSLRHDLTEISPKMGETMNPSPTEIPDSTLEMLAHLKIG